MTFTASRKLYLIGGLLFAALLICSRSAGVAAGASFLVPLVVAGLIYLAAIREFFRTPRFPRKVIYICLLLAMLWRIPFLMMPPGPDDDIHRYLWDGRVQRLGFNPYKLVPADPAVARLHTPETRELNNPEVPSPYPAGAQLFFRGVTTIHESIFAFKIAFVVCDFAIVLLLLHILRRSGQGEHWVLAYAWHPLLATNVVGSGHIDILGALLLLVSIAAIGRGWRMLAAMAFSLAVAVKFLPIVLAPLYWKRLRIRDGLLAVVTFGLLYLPFLDHGRIPFGSLSIYVQRFRFNDPIFSTIERVTSPQIVAGLAVLAGLVTAAFFRRKDTAYWADQYAWPMAASFACAPVVYPWYLLWLLPFLSSSSTIPLMVWTVSILPTYYIWHLRMLGGEWHLPAWILWLEFGSVAAAITIMQLRRRVQPTEHASTVDTPAEGSVLNGEKPG